MVERKVRLHFGGQAGQGYQGQIDGKIRNDRPMIYFPMESMYGEWHNQIPDLVLFAAVHNSTRQNLQSVSNLQVQHSSPTVSNYYRTLIVFHQSICLLRFNS